MPPLEEMDRCQKALLWAKVGDDAHAEPKVSPAVELNPETDDSGVRWVHKARLMLDPTGNSIMVDSTVVVNIDVPIGSIIWEGGLDDLTGTGTTPTPPGDLMVVVTSDRASDLKNRFVRRTLGLKRFRESLPRVVG